MRRSVIAVEVMPKHQLKARQVRAFCLVIAFPLWRWNACTMLAALCLSQWGTRNLTPNPFQLKRSLSPIAIWVTLIIVFNLVALLDAFSKIPFDWGALEGSAFISLLCIFIIYLNLSYTVTWDGKAIVQTAFGLHRVVITPSEITAIRSERSNARELAQANRPSNRIAIYAGKRFIDVSLKHFQFSDVGELVKLIHAIRPDLSWDKVPKTLLR